MEYGTSSNIGGFIWMKNKDERDSHFIYSIWKSGVRVGGCVIPFVFMEPWAWQVFLGAFFVAEILGIIEEI